MGETIGPWSSFAVYSGGAFTQMMLVGIQCHEPKEEVVGELV